MEFTVWVPCEKLVVELGILHNCDDSKDFGKRGNRSKKVSCVSVTHGGET